MQSDILPTCPIPFLCISQTYPKDAISRERDREREREGKNYIVARVRLAARARKERKLPYRAPRPSSIRSAGFTTGLRRGPSLRKCGAPLVFPRERAPTRVPIKRIGQVGERTGTRSIDTTCSSRDCGLCNWVARESRENRSLAICDCDIAGLCNWVARENRPLAICGRDFRRQPSFSR